MPGTQEILAILEALQKLLAKSPWSSKLESVAQGFGREATRGIAFRELTSYFGGMGSLNDVVLCEENQNLPDGLGRDEANERLAKLLDDLFAQLSTQEPGSSGIELPARIRSAFRGGGSGVA